MARRDRLTKLTPELFESIAEYLGPPDLASLRIANKDAKVKTQRVFLHTTFGTMAFVLSDEKSLHRAIQAARHPVFGPTIQTLCFYMDQLEAHEGYSGHPDLVTVHDEKNYAFPLLTTLFSYLRKPGSLRAVKIVDLAAAKNFERFPRPYCGFPLVAVDPNDNDNDDYIEFLYEDKDTALDTVIETLSLCDVGLEAFDIMVDSEQWAIDMYSRVALFRLPACHDVFGRLTELCVSIYVDHFEHTIDEHQRDDWLEGGVEEMWSQLNGLNQLKKFTIRGRYVYPLPSSAGYLEAKNHAPFDEILLTNHMPALEYLSLENCCFNMDDMQAYVRTSPRLRTLDLKNCWFGPKPVPLEPGLSTVQYIRSKTGLQNVLVDIGTEVRFTLTKLEWED